MTVDLSGFVGKTVHSIEQHEGYIGVSVVTIIFTDGDSVEFRARGCDEGGWQEISTS